VNFGFLKKLLPSRSWRHPPSSAKARAGRSGERHAVRHLRRCGCRILARNYECAAGEIDLIASDADTIVFVEVKSRSDSPAVDQPQFSVRLGQQDRIGRAARHFLRQTGAENRPCRFDIVTVTWLKGAAAEVEHFKDAFHPRGTH